MYIYLFLLFHLWIFSLHCSYSWQICIKSNNALVQLLLFVCEFDRMSCTKIFECFLNCCRFLKLSIDFYRLRLRHTTKKALDLDNKLKSSILLFHNTKYNWMNEWESKVLKYNPWYVYFYSLYLDSCYLFYFIHTTTCKIYSNILINCWMSSSCSTMRWYRRLCMNMYI